MSLRDDFRGRDAGVVEPAVLPADPKAHAAAERQLEVEQRTLQGLLAVGVSDATREAQERLVDAAVERLAALPTITVQLRTLLPEQWSTLVERHPPTPEQLKLGQRWNRQGMQPELLAAAVLVPEDDPPMTVQEWKNYATEGRLTPGEFDVLFFTAVNLQERQPQVSTGKG